MRFCEEKWEFARFFLKIPFFLAKRLNFAPPMRRKLYLCHRKTSLGSSCCTERRRRKGSPQYIYNFKNRRMKVLAFAGTNSRQSINKALLRYALSLAEELEIEWADMNDYEMPIYSIERNEEGVPEAAHAFKRKLDAADAIACALAEHNGAFTTAFKNLYDWTSRIDMNVFGQKPMLVMSTSPGPHGGATVLKLAVDTFPWFGGNIVSQFWLPSFGENFDMEQGVMRNAEFDAQLRAEVARWKEAIAQHVAP